MSVFDASFNDEEIQYPLEDEFEEENISDVRSTITEDVVMEGRMSLRYGVEIAGNYKGAVHSNSKVHILPGGLIEGDIEAFHVIIQGLAKAGKMVAKKRFEILNGGKFIGSLETQPEVLVLSEFAEFGADDETAARFAKEYVRDRKTGEAGESKPE